ncbi:MAG TPA: response regulator [Stellaceae bacterium]|jgi:CheY-like chemotaxis protein
MAGETQTILAVEDQPDVLDLAAAFLSDEGYRVLAASSGDAAIPMLVDTADIDLVFTDIVMPGQANGFAVARKAVALRPGIKVLYTSGYAEQLHKNQPLVARGDLLPKPYRLERLKARVDELLNTPPEELNRVLRTAFRRWCRCRADPAQPFLDEETAVLLPHLSFVEPAAGGGFRYRSTGSALIPDFGLDLSGRPVGENVDKEHRRFLLGIYREVFETGKPIYIASAYATPTATLATERLFLPLPADAPPAREVVVAQTFDHIEARSSIPALLREGATRRDLVRRIEP